MKNSFPGYYRPTDEEFSTMWDGGLFVLDANVLLNLYRYSQDTYEKLIGILNQISNRLWVPHQAALEYQRGRWSVFTEHAKAYKKIKKALDETQGKIESCLSSVQKHPHINAKVILEKVSNLFGEVKSELCKKEQNHPDMSDNDPVRDAITCLLEGKVGESYSLERLEQIHKEGEKRYKQEIPPGYEDVPQKEGTRKYGDLVLWFQIIDKAKETKEPIIFVTDDSKGDWWFRWEGKTIGPRAELVNEIRSEAGVLFYMYPADSFMERAGQHFKQPINDEVLEEAREVRGQYERRYLLDQLGKSVQIPTAISGPSPALATAMEQLERMKRLEGPSPALATVMEQLERLREQLERWGG